MEKAKKRLSLIFALLIFASLTSLVFADQSDMEFLFLKNGSIIKCDAVWRGLGDYVWCSTSGGTKGYPADEVDLVMTFETQPVVNRLVNQSRASFEKGDWESVIKAASEALKLYPGSEVAYTNRSGAYANLGWQYQALSDAEAALKINPHFGLAYNNRGYALQIMGKLPQARKDYETSCRLGEKLGCVNYDRLFASEIRPRVEKLLDRSHESFLKGDWDAVIGTTTEALELNPKSELAFANRAGAYANKGQPEKALRDSDEAIKINPGLALAHNNRGYALERLSRFIEASKEYDASCRLGSELGCTNYARVFASEIRPKVEKLLDQSVDSFQRQDWDGVIEATSKALELDPDNEVAFTNRAGAYAHQGMFEKAIQDCDEAIRINPNFGLAYNNRGYTLELMGKRRQAALDYNTSCLLRNERGCQNYARLGR